MARSPLRPLLPWLAVALLSLWIIVQVRPQVLPRYRDVDALSRSEIGERMQRFLSDEVGELEEGYRFDFLFTRRGTTRDYLHQLYGVEAIREADRNGVAVWIWRGRWFKPGSSVDYRVELDQHGRLVSWNWQHDGTLSDKTFSREEAYALAQAYLREKTPWHPPQALQLTRESATSDRYYSFEWERSDLQTWGAPVLVSVGVDQDRVVRYREGLKIPQAWEDARREARSVNRLAGLSAGLAASVVILIAVVMVLRAMSRGEFRLQKVLPWGWYLVVGVLLLGDEIREIPYLLMTYRTIDAWGAWIAQKMLAGLGEAAFGVFVLWIIALLADRFYRQRFPQFAPLATAFSPAALGRRETTVALGVGVVFALVKMVYSTFFYLIGKQWGVWVPLAHLNDGGDSWLAWMSVVKSGLLPALREELVDRVIIFVVLWRLLGNRWVAILLGSAIWAFLHSSYPQMPGYIRGLELLPSGILYCWLLQRYGIIAPVVAHLLYNSLLKGMSFLVVPGLSLLDSLTIWGAMLWPVALLGWSWWRGRQQVEPVSSFASAEVMPPRREPSAWVPCPVPVLTFRRPRLAIGALLLLAPLGLVITFFPSKEPPPVKLATSRSGIKAAADHLLQERGADPARFHHVISLNAREVRERDYFYLKHGDRSTYLDFFAREWGEAFWKVRYFRFLDREAYQLTFDVNGKLREMTHTVAEEAPGPRLERDAALSRSLELAARDFGFSPEEEKLVSESFQERPHRRDWYFAFNRNGFSMHNATLRTSFTLQGDEVVDFTRSFSLQPADFNQVKKDESRREFLSQFAAIPVTLLTLFSLLGVCVVVVMRGVVPWRIAFRLALPLLGLTVLVQLNEADQFLASCPPGTSWHFHLLGAGSKKLVEQMVYYLMAVLGLGVMLGLYTRRGEGRALETLFWPRDSRERFQLWRDATIRAGLALSCLALLSGIQWSEHLADPLSKPVEMTVPAITGFFPWLTHWKEAIWTGFWLVIVVSLLIGSFHLLRQRFPRLAIGWFTTLVASLFILIFVSVEGLEEGALFAGGVFLIMALLFGLFDRLLRFHPLALFLLATGGIAIGTGMTLLKAGGPFYQWLSVPLFLPIITLVVILSWQGRQRDVPVKEKHAILS